LTRHADNVNLITWLHQVSAVYGAAVLVALTVIGALAWRSGRRDLAALSAVALVLSTSVVLDFAVFPVANSLSLAYLIDSLWIVGILVWIVVGWGAGALVIELLGRRNSLRTLDGATPPSPDPTPRADDRRVGPVLPVVALGVVILIAVVGAIGIHEQLTAAPEDEGAGWSPAENAAIASATSAIEEDMTGRGPIYLYLSTGPGNYGHFLESLHITEGVAWRLSSDGWMPALSDNLAVYTGTPVPPHDTIPAASVSLNGATVTSIYQGYCWRGVSTCYKAKPPDVPLPKNPFRNLTFSK
jgi:hypothetical protein